MKERMEKLILVLIVLFVIYGLVLIFYTPKKKEADLKIATYQINEGFGYQILNKDKVLIKQDFIPAVQEKKAFKSQRDAEQVAKLVKYKLLKGQSPVIKLKDLNALDIEYKVQMDRP